MRYALRQLAKSPGFTIVAILTLALGIGANAAMFSFINSWILRPPSFPNANQLVVLFSTDKHTGNTGPSAPADFNDWRDRAGIFENLAAAMFGSFNLTGIDEPQRIAGFYVSPNFFRTLGAKPELGREFAENEQVLGQDNVVILSHALWRDRFSSDPKILGQKITLDGAAMTIIGVMPEEFQYIPMGPAEVFAPIALAPERRAARDSRFLQVVGRLKPGMDPARANSAMTALQTSLEKTYPLTNTNRGVLVRSLQAEINRQSGNDAVKICYAIVCFVLLMACANVANLIMARATGRRKEMAVRLAIGAGRWRLVRQLLGETLLLFASGAILGVFIAQWGVRYLLHAIPARSFAYLPNHGRVELDWQVLLFTMSIAFVTGLAFGLAPALEGTRFDLNNTLKDAGGRGMGSLSGGRFRKILVAGEMALAVMVVVSGALLVNSFIHMMSVNPGFDGEKVLVADIQLPPKYRTPSGIAQFFDSVVSRVSTTPGVDRVSLAQFTPFLDRSMVTPLVIEGRPDPPNNQGPNARTNLVAPGYLELMSIPLIAGRTISRQDVADAPLVAVINETIAKRFFPGENPLGRKIILSRKNSIAYTIVGVVKEVKYYSLQTPAENQVYRAFAQTPPPGAVVVVRAAGDPSAVAPAIREAVRQADPNQPVSRIMTISNQIEEENAPQKILMQVTGFFGLLALFLASIGIYGVMAYSVSQRTQEIGVRMALGARGGDVLRLIVGQGMGIVLGGMVVGIMGAVVMAKFLAQFLFGIQPTDPLTFATTFTALASVALLACWIPARRAARVDPLVALRHE